MGLLNYLQEDPNKQAALRQGLLNAGIAMMGSQSSNFMGSAAQGASSGMQAYTKQFEEQKRKITQQQAMQAARTPAQPATPAAYGVGGNVGNADFAQMAAAQNRDINAMSGLPRMDKPYAIPQGNGVATLPLKGAPAPMPQPIDQPVDEAALQMAANQEQATPEMPAELLPEQIQQVSAAQPAQAAGLDFDKFAESILTNPDAPPELQELAIKYFSGKKPEKPIVLGKSLIDPVTNKVIATDETWREEKDVARQQRIEELNMRLEDQKLSREQQADLRRELAGQQTAMRRDLAAQASADRRMLAEQRSADRRVAITQGNKPPSGYRYTPEGNLEMIPGGPADTKRQAQLEGGGTVDTVVADLRDMYDQLDEKGGITSTQNRWGSNLAAGVQSSGAGQSLGKLFGTESQSLRNTVAQKRPLLLQAIMKATGMTAKQMDSNTELKLYLSTATDPTLDLETNRRALAMIEKLYGSGAGNAPIAPKQPPKDVKDLPKKKAANSPPMKGQVVDGYRFKGGDPASASNWEKAK